MFLTVLRWLAVPVGLLAYYIAFCMYEDEEGKWQNRVETFLENLWVAVNDKATQGRTAALFGKVAAIVTKAFDRIFGHKLLSFQFVGVSVCYSFAPLFLVISLVFVILKKKPDIFSVSPPPADLLEQIPFLVVFCLVVGITFVVLGTLPAIFPSRWSVTLSMCPALFLIFCFVVIAKTHAFTQRRVSFFAALILSLLSDVFLLVLIRFAVRWVLAKTSAWRAAVMLVIQVAVVYFLVLVPFAIPAAVPEEFQQSVLLQTLVGVGWLSLFTGIASSIFVLVLLFVLLHRISWPVVSRLLYSVARFKVIRNRKLMAALGTACLVFAFPAMSNWVKAVLGLLAK